MDPKKSQPQHSGYYQPILQEEEGMDIKRYLSLFLSNWYWFAASLFIAITMAYGINRYSEKTYTVTSSLLIKDDQLTGGVSGVGNIFPGGDLLRSQQNLQNEIGILKSYSLNYRVIKQLPDFHITYVSMGRRNIAETKMYKECPFEVLTDSLEKMPKLNRFFVYILSGEKYRIESNGDNHVSFVARFGEPVLFHGYSVNVRLRDPSNFRFDDEISNKYYLYFDSPDRLANIYRSKLNISPIQEDASMVTLSVTGNVPQQEADYLNKLMEEYINQGLEVKNKTAEKTIEFIDQQLGLISDSLTIAEDRLQNFKLANSLVNLSSEGTIIQNKLDRFETERATIELQLQYYKYLIDYINSKSESGDIVAPSVVGVNDPAINNLIVNLATLQNQKRQLSINISGEMPALSLIETNIENAREVLKENVENSLINLQAVLKSVSNKITNIEDEIRKLPGTERKLVGIERKFNLNNTVYTFLLEKRAEAGISKASNVSENRIIDNAEVFNSSNVKPKRRQNYLIAFLLAMVLPMILIFIFDNLNDKIINKTDIEKRTTVPLIGYIGHNDFKSELPVFLKPRSTLAESFRSIRTSLKEFENKDSKLVLSITSTISSEGKTFVSTNLSAIVSMLGKKVLLIGLDLRKPRIHNILNISNEIGLSTYLSGDNNYEDIIIKTEHENFYYTPSGPVPPNPSELIESERMIRFIDRAKKDFDYIILDTPPVAIVTDAVILSKFADVSLFVVRQRFTSKNTLNLIQELYDNKAMGNIRIITNDINVTGYYGYGLRYGYNFYTGYGYNYGYGQYGYTGESRYSYYRNKKDGYYVND